MTNILESINFLFLLALAVITWVILCYFQYIEDQRAEDFKLAEFYLAENVNTPTEPIVDEEDMPQPGNNGYDICLNIVCIFACIYMLTKLTHVTERFVIKFMQEKIKKATSERYNRWPYMDGDQPPHLQQQQKQQQEKPNQQQENEPPPKSPEYCNNMKKDPCEGFDYISVEGYRAKQAVLEKHIKFMEKQNAELRQQIREMNNVMSRGHAHSRCQSHGPAQRHGQSQSHGPAQGHGQSHGHGQGHGQCPGQSSGQSPGQGHVNDHSPGQPKTSKPMSDRARQQCLSLALNEFRVSERTRTLERIARQKEERENDTNSVTIEKPTTTDLPKPKILAPAPKTMPMPSFLSPMSIGLGTIMPENCNINFEAKPVEPSSTTDYLSDRIVWQL